MPILTWRDLLAGPLGIDVAFGDGFVDVRSIAFTDASGAAVWVGGKIKNLDGVPTAESLQFDMKVSDVARFARATRTDIAACIRVNGPKLALKRHGRIEQRAIDGPGHGPRGHRT